MNDSLTNRHHNNNPNILEIIQSREFNRIPASQVHSSQSKIQIRVLGFTVQFNPQLIQLHNQNSHNFSIKFT